MPWGIKKLNPRLPHGTYGSQSGVPRDTLDSPPFSPAPGLNEELVQLLLIRDELHTEQDAMLVDIEDLTR